MNYGCNTQITVRSNVEKVRLPFKGKHASSNWQQKKKKRKTKAKK